MKTREILQDMVLDACLFVLAKGPRFEIETLQELRRTIKRTKNSRIGIDYIETAMGDLVELGLIKREDCQYSLINN